MKSRISFFNFTVFFKDLLRLLPLWAIYLLLGVLFLFLKPIVSSNPIDYSDSLAFQKLTDNLCYLEYLIPVFAIITAQIIFGDLFSPRRSNALHALSIRREGWFLTHIAAGLVASIVPNLLLSLSFLPLPGNGWDLIGGWVLFITEFYLLLFSFAVFSAMCSGNRIGASAIYLLFLFGPFFLYWVAETIYLPLLYGLLYNKIDPYYLSPYIGLLYSGRRTLFVDMIYYLSVDDILRSNIIHFAVTSILMLVISLLLYRRRKLECAGEVMAFRWMRPVFVVLFTLGVGVCAEFIGSEFFGINYIFLIIGIVMGYVSSQMLLQRTIKVFSLKSLGGFAAIAVSLALSIGLSVLDPMGITRWTPNLDQVESVAISNTHDPSPFPRDTIFHYDHYYTEPATIEAWINVHQKLIDDGQPKGDSHGVRIIYTMKNGRKVLRHYLYPAEGDTAQLIQQQKRDPKLVLGYTDWDAFLRSVSGAELGARKLDGAQVYSVLEAVREDIEAGNIQRTRGISYIYRYYETVTINLHDRTTIMLNVTDDDGSIAQWKSENIPSN